MAHDKPLFVAQISGRGDKAFDRDHKDFRRALTEYARTRGEKHLAAIPLLEGRKPRLFEVKVLTAHARSIVLGEADEAARRLLAVRAGVSAIRHADGTTEQPKVASRGELGQLADADWAERIYELGGGYLVDELGAAVIHRTNCGDWDEAEGADPLDPFVLPRGVKLAL